MQRVAAGWGCVTSLTLNPVPWQSGHPTSLAPLRSTHSRQRAWDTCASAAAAPARRASPHAAGLELTGAAQHREPPFLSCHALQCWPTCLQSQQGPPFMKNHLDDPTPLFSMTIPCSSPCTAGAAKRGAKAGWRWSGVQAQALALPAPPALNCLLRRSPTASAPSLHPPPSPSHAGPACTTRLAAPHLQNLLALTLVRPRAVALVAGALACGASAAGRVGVTAPAHSSTTATTAQPSRWRRAAPGHCVPPEQQRLA